MKTICVALAFVILSPWALAQKIELKLDHLKAKAKESVEADIDGSLMDYVKKLGLKDADVVNGIKGVYFRTFEFDSPGQYAEADIDSVLKQVRGVAGWSRVVNVRDKRDRVEVHLKTEGDQVTGMLVVVAEPNELVVLHLNGMLPAEKVRALLSDKHFDFDFDITKLPGVKVSSKK